MNKLISLQILRGIAAWLVVYHHFIVRFYTSIVKAPSVLGRYFQDYGNFGVDIFFVLSGLVMYFSIKNHPISGVKFFLNRLFRIFPVYWALTFVLLISIYFLSDKAFITAYNYKTLLLSLFLIPHENLSGCGSFPVLTVGWTLIFEMFFYLILSISLILTKKLPLLFCSITLFIVPIILGDFELLGHSNYKIYEFLAGILLGYIFKGYFLMITNSKFYINILLTVLLFILFYSFKWEPVIKLISAPIIVSLFFINEEVFNRKNIIIKFLITLGDISYSTYLIHTIVLGWFYYFLYIKMHIIINEFFIILLISIVVFFLSKISYDMFENAEWIKNVKNKVNSYLKN